MSAPSLRVYFVTHHDGRMTGRLLAPWGGTESPSGFADTEDDVYAQLEPAIEAKLDEEPGWLGPWLWNEDLQTRTIKLSVHPQAGAKKRFVIGKQEVPLRLTFGWSKLPAGGYRVILPRFGWWYILEDLDMAPGVLRQAVSNALLGEQGASLFDFRAQGEEFVRPWSPRVLSRRREPSAVADEDAFPTLHQVGENLVARNLGGPRPIVVGEFDFEPYRPLLGDPRPRSLLLVGPSGVGKTTWVRELARHMAKVPIAHDERRLRIWSTSADRIIAGQIYLGMWEQRCLDIIRELSDEGDYLYVDRLASLMLQRSGRSSIADLLAPAVIAGDIHLIAECDEREYEALLGKASTLMGVFHVIRLAPPSAAAMPALLRQYQSRRSSTVSFSGAGLTRLVDHLDFFKRDEAFPGKGFRFFDWFAEQHRDETQERSLGSAGASRAFSRWTGLPVELISEDNVASASHICDALSTAVIGQPQACAIAARVLARFKAGLNDPDKPVGSLLLVGPTGVGKTELAKQLTTYMFGAADRMVRLDMSEFMLPGSSQALLATGRGVRSLAERVRQQPLSLVLLDELEKAHAEVFDLLLGVLGEGRLTDAEGNLVDFRMALIVMTSNLGIARAPDVGFGGDPEQGGQSVAVVRRHFRPEFFNRLDFVVPLRNLDPGDIRRIVDLEIGKLADRQGLRRRNLRLRVDPEARDQLAAAGWHPTHGARPLKRVIEEHVMAPIAVLLSSHPTWSDRVIDVVPAHRSERDATSVVLPSELGSG